MARQQSGDQTPPAASIPLLELLRIVCSYQQSQLLALRPSSLTVKERVLYLQQAGDLLTKQLAVYGCEVTE